MKDEDIIIKGRSATKRYRKGALVDNSDAGQQDIRISSIPSLNTPGWFINQPGNARNFQSYIDEKFDLLSDSYTVYSTGTETITKTGLPIADFTSTAVDMRTFNSGSYILNISAYVDGGGSNLEIKAQYSIDGVTYGQVLVSVATVTATGNFFIELEEEQQKSGYMRLYFDCDAHTTLTGTLYHIAKR